MRILRQSEVTPDLAAWALRVLVNPLGYSEDKAGFRAVVETHTNGTKTNPTPHPHKGVTLYALESGETHPLHSVYAEGIDVSDYQPKIDWQKVAASGRSFVWIKATEGVTHTQRLYQVHAEGARDAGLKVGFYHFMHASDPIEQAKHFLGAIPACDLPPVLDAEAIYHDESKLEFANACAAWLDYVDTQFVHPMLYTMPGFWNGLPDVGIGKLCDLWVAHWDVGAPAECKGLPPWRVWQYSAKGTVPGYPGLADVNRMREAVA